MKELNTSQNNYAKNLSNTLKKLMELHHINMNQLHKRTGVPLTTINRLFNDQNINPTISSLLPIANYFNITLNQLMGIDPLSTDKLIGKYTKKTNLWTEVPIISWEQAITWPANFSSLAIESTISTDISLGENPFALVINEINWEGFFPNTVIIAEPNSTPEHGDYAITLKIGQKRASLKQILIDDDKTYLRPVNKDYQTQMMDQTFQLLGVVTQIRMDRKTKKYK